MSTKRNRIRVFDAFGRALALLEKEDSCLYTWTRNRISLAHALAMHLKDIISKDDKSIAVDLCPVLAKSSRLINPDILVHNRTTGQQYLSIICRSEYLTEIEQRNLIELRKNSKCELVLGLSFKPQKNYMLIYVTTMDGIEYYHFNRNTQTLEPVRKRIIQESSDTNDQQPILEKMLQKN